jgi:hypothetical protein
MDLSDLFWEFVDTVLYKKTEERIKTCPVYEHMSGIVEAVNDLMPFSACIRDGPRYTNHDIESEEVYFDRRVGAFRFKDINALFRHCPLILIHQRDIARVRVCVDILQHAIDTCEIMEQINNIDLQ